eukprot:765784-Hanusia_phi.AAC.1
MKTLSIFHTHYKHVLGDCKQDPNNDKGERNRVRKLDTTQGVWESQKDIEGGEWRGGEWRIKESGFMAERRGREWAQAGGAAAA